MQVFVKSGRVQEKTRVKRMKWKIADLAGIGFYWRKLFMIFRTFIKILPFCYLLVSIVFFPLLGKDIQHDSMRSDGDTVFNNDALCNNIIRDFSFESQLHSDWIFTHFSGKGNIIQDDESKSGHKSVKISGTNNDRTGVEYQPQLGISVKSGEVYDFNLWYKVKSLNPQKDGSGAFVRFSFTDDNRKVFGNPHEYVRYIYLSPEAANWTKLTSRIYVPFGNNFEISKCFITLFLSHCSGAVWFDDITLEKTRTPLSTIPVSSCLVKKYLKMFEIKPPPLLNSKVFNEPVLQLWPKGAKTKGNPSVEILKKADLWIPVFKDKLGIGAIASVRLENNDIGTGLVSDHELQNTIDKFQNAGIKFILYTSLMHVGHDLSWHEMVRVNPEWLRRTEYNQTVGGFGDARLCFNNHFSFNYCLAYIEKCIQQFHPDAIMIDNHEPHNCFCQACLEKFKFFLANKFNEEEFKELFSVSKEDFQKTPSEYLNTNYNLYRAWINYSYYVCCNALYETRQTLERNQTGITANIRPFFDRFPNLPHPFDFQDFIFFESGICDQRSEYLAEMLIIAKCLAGDKIVYNYSYTWEYQMSNHRHLYDRMLPPEKIKLLVADIISHNVIPWYLCNGLDSIAEPFNINRDSIEALGQYNRFFIRNKEVFAGTSYSNWGVLLPDYPESSTVNTSGKGMLLPFIKNQMPIELNKNITAQNLLKYKIFFLIDIKSLSNEEISLLNDYIQRGGILVIKSNSPPNIPMFKENYIVSSIEQVDDEITGKVINAYALNDLDIIINKLKNICFIKLENSLSDLEIVTYQKHTSNPQLIIHYLNHSTKKIKNLKTIVKIPQYYEVVKLDFITPEHPENLNIEYKMNSTQELEFQLSELDIYGIVIISLKTPYLLSSQ